MARKSGTFVKGVTDPFVSTRYMKQDEKTPLHLIVHISRLVYNMFVGANFWISHSFEVARYPYFLHNFLKLRLG